MARKSTWNMDEQVDHAAQKCKALLRWDRFTVFVDFVQSVAAIHEMPIPTRGEIETELFNRSIGLGPISDTFIGKHALPLFDGVVKAGVKVPGWPEK